MQTDTMNVTGMYCGGCVTKLELALNRIVGVDNVQISLASGEVTVVYDVGDGCHPHGLRSAWSRRRERT